MPVAHGLPVVNFNNNFIHLLGRPVDPIKNSQIVYITSTYINSFVLIDDCFAQLAPSQMVMFCFFYRPVYNKTRVTLSLCYNFSDPYRINKLKYVINS